MIPKENGDLDRLSLCMVIVGGLKGTAGHFYSAHDLAVALSSKGIHVEIKVLALRPGAHAKILEALPYHAVVPLFKGVFSSLGALRAEIRRSRFSGVIAFDEIGCRIINLLFPFNSINLVPLKPGWINTNSWISTCADFICFSKENADFYAKSKRYAATQIHYIPNRVISAVSDESKIADIRGQLGIPADDKIIVAAGRIDIGAGGKPGKQSIFVSALNLFEALNDRHQLHLVIMGKPVNHASTDWIQDMAGNRSNVHVFSSDIATDKLSAVLALGDCVVAQGRTAMESMSLGLPTFVPIDGLPLPVMVNEDTFDTLLYSNFSGRVEPADFANLQSADELITRIFFSNQQYLEISGATRNLFTKSLHIEEKINLYKDIIKNKKSVNISIKKLMSWCNSCLRVLVIYSRLSLCRYIK